MLMSDWLSNAAFRLAFVFRMSFDTWVFLTDFSKKKTNICPKKVCGDSPLIHTQIVLSFLNSTVI